MATKNKLSVYLVKDGITSVNDIFEEPEKIRVLERYSEDSAAYFVPSLAHEPNWLRSFFLRGGDGMLLQANSRVVLIKSIQIDEEYRTFALTFGYARFLFREDVLEEQFGLKIVLNSIKQNQIRRISKASVGSNQKQSDEQLPKSSDISEFGFDVNRDLMKNVSGKSEDDMFEKSMLTGGDIFSLTVARDIRNIDEFLVFCYRRFKEDTYQERFAWIDNIKYVKEKAVIQQLNEKLIATIRANEFDRVWMAVPEVVAWEDIRDFKFTGSDETFGDIYIDKVIESMRNELTCVEQLQSKRIYARASRDGTENAYEWSAYKCIIAEINLDGQEYNLNNGKWYKINNDFVANINERYLSIELCQDVFIDYGHNNEDRYNDALSASLANSYLLHKYKIAIGGGQGNNIEPCDILWQNKLIHVKRNGGSSQLSHLFNQALVAGQMWLDQSFRSQLRAKMEADGYPDVIPEPFNSSDYEIVIAIINTFHDDRPKIPFFSKVAICFTAANARNLGYRLLLKNIQST